VGDIIFCESMTPFTICGESEDENRDDELDYSEGEPENLAARVNSFGVLTLHVS
jgi:hypothetical protein